MSNTSSAYHGYLVLLSTFLLNFVAIGSFNSAGLYLGPLAITFPAAGSSKLALYCTFQIVAGLSSSLVGGIAQDVLEKRQIGLRWLFFGGGFFMMMGFFWSSFASSLVGVLLGSILMGIGLGLGGFMAGGICVLWFEAARGMMLLLAMSGQGIGNVFFAWATAKLLERYDYFDDPWRPTMQIIGIFSFFVCALASIPMRLPLEGEVEEHEKKNRGGESAPLNLTDSIDFSTAGNSTNFGGVKNEHQLYASNARAFEQMCIETGHTRQSMLPKEQRRRSTMLASFQAVGSAPFVHLSPYSSDDSSLFNLSIMPDHDTNHTSTSLYGDIIENDYSLKELSFSSSNIWLNVFTLIACFPFLNMQGRRTFQQKYL